MIAFPLGVLCCLGIGQRLARESQDNAPLAVGIAAACFFVLFGTTCTLLGFLDLLKATVLWPILGLMVLGIFWRAKPVFRFKPSIEMAAIPFLMTPYFLLAKVPIWYRDSLTYHAAMAKQYALKGGFHHGDLIVFSFFPQSWQSFLAGWICLFPEGELRLISAGWLFFVDTPSMESQQQGPTDHNH